MANQERIRLVNCFYQPSQVFSIYDYTKIIYHTDGYICIRQISTLDSQPTFIKLEHEYQHIHSFLTFPNLIITLQENLAKQFSLGFYDSAHFHLKLGSSLAQEFKKVFESQKNDYIITKKLQFKIRNSSDHIFILLSLTNQSPFNPIKDINKNSKKDTILLSNQQANDNELIVINLKTKRVVGRSYFSGNVKQFIVKFNQEFTILHEDSSLLQFKLNQNLASQQSSQSMKVAKKREIELIHPNPKSKSNILGHIWIKDELIVANASLGQIGVYVENKKTQSISMQSIKKFKLFCSLICGFIVCNENFLFVYKKMEFEYVCIAQFFIRQIGFSPQLILSPQEDIIAYFMQSNKSIQYIKNFNDEIEAQFNSQKKMAKQIKNVCSIQFKRSNHSRIDVNRKNNTFAISNQSNIQLYSINNFQLYLEQSIQSQESFTSSPVSKGRLKRLNTLGAVQGFIQKMSKAENIYSVAIHPFSQILAIALKSKVRVYQILYNQLFHIKDILVSNCNQIFFSNSGQFLSLVVSGKNGSKCYVYKSNEDYQLLECLSIGKKILKFIWSKYDNYLYGVYSNGYYRWSIENNMKSRFDTLFDIPFAVTDAILNEKKDAVILYGEYNILEINPIMDKENQLNPKDIISIPKSIKQIIYQNGSFFLNLKEKSSDVSERIIKCDQILKIQSLINQNFTPTSKLLSNSKPLTFYQQSNGQSHSYYMIPCSGYSNRNIIMLLEEQTKNIKMLQWGKGSGAQAKVKRNNDLIKIDRKNLKKLFKKYSKYQDEVKEIEQNLRRTMEQIKTDLLTRQRQREQAFLRQIKGSQQKYECIKVEKQKLEHTIEEKIQKHQEQTIKQVKQLQKIYERKIAITTNKLLTSQEINYRNMLLAEENLKKLERMANNDVQKIREQYKRQLADYMSEKDTLVDEILRMKKEYESRLYDLQIENQRILQQFQSKTEDDIQKLKRNLVSEEIKYSEALSKKDNLQKSLHQNLITVQILRQKIAFLEAKNKEANKKAEFLLLDIQKYEKIMEEKNSSIAIYEQRINDLQKSNQILKYRVIELKGQTEPQSIQNQKLKQNLNELESQYDKIVKNAFEKEQLLSILKKESQKSKQTSQKLQIKVKKLQKSYWDFLDRVMNITKAPIQEIRKQLINLLNTTKQDEKYLNRPTSSYASNQSPLGQLNRIREHLQVCLNQAMDSNKKGQQQKKIDLLKKNRQNSELIKEINDLRRRVRDFQTIIKQKDLQINRLIRGDPIALNQIKVQSLKENSRQQKTEVLNDENEKESISFNNYQVNEKIPSRSQTRKQTRETKESFFDKSLFKSGSNWREKRLRTEESKHRQAYTRSVKRNNSNKFLKIQNKGGYDDFDDLKRIIEQKQTIIQQLINKIQSLS